VIAVDAPTEPDALTEAYAYRPEPEAAPRWWRTRRERPPLPAAISVIVRASIACAVLAAALVGYALWISALPQARAQQELYGQLRDELAQATAPLGGDIKAGEPVALLEAPTIGLSQVVVEGTGSTQLRAGPGHRRDTPLPGQPGISHVYGHASAFGAPFRSIVQLRPGETITVTTGQGQFSYHVAAVRRAGDPGPAAMPKGHSRMTLATAEGGGWRAGWAPDKVVYVDALLDGETQLPPPGRPTTISTAEWPMQGDPDALLPLILWLWVLVAAALTATWARARWGGAQVWVVGVPVLLAGLWGVLENLTQLLPNLA
jgi:sortase A